VKSGSIVSNVSLNTFGVFFYFFCQWVMTVVVTRLAGFEVAGSFLLAIAFSNIFAFIGLFGVRGYQICDVREQFSNGEYVASRIVSVGASLVPFAVVLYINGYDQATTLACLAFMVFKVLEGFSDVLLGIMQRSNHYPWLAVSYTLKGALTLAAFTLLLLAGQSLFVAILGMAVVYLPVLLLHDAVRLRHLGAFALHFGNLKTLYIACFPLMLHSLLLAVLVYLPREAIASLLGKAEVGYYGALAMVIVVFSTLAGAVSSGINPALSRMLAANNTTGLRKLFSTMFFSVLVASAAILILGKLLGPWVFGWLFGAEILPYMYMLTPVLVSAILLMCVSMFDGFFIALDKRVLLLACNVVGTAFCWATVSWLTQNYGIFGANLSMIGGLALRLAMLGGLSLWLLRERFGVEVLKGQK